MPLLFPEKIVYGLLSFFSEEEKNYNKELHYQIDKYISTVSEEQYCILTKIYVDAISVSQIARQMNRSYYYISQQHKIILYQLLKKYDKTSQRKNLHHHELAVKSIHTLYPPRM